MDLPSAAGSSEGFSAAGNPLVGDAGPAFDPREAAQPTSSPLSQGGGAVWEAGRVRRILRTQGLLTHEWVGVGVDDWLWRESELEAISEPLADAMNRIPMVAAAAAVSDELTVGAVAFEYAFRSIKERSRIVRAMKEAEEAEERLQAHGPIAGPRAFSTGVTPDASDDAAPTDSVQWEVQ